MTDPLADKARREDVPPELTTERYVITPSWAEGNQ